MEENEGEEREREDAATAKMKERSETDQWSIDESVSWDNFLFFLYFFLYEAPLTRL